MERLHPQPTLKPTHTHTYTRSNDDYRHNYYYYNLQADDTVVDYYRPRQSSVQLSELRVSIRTLHYRHNYRQKKLREQIQADDTVVDYHRPR